jgi:hypothetical protein
MYGARRHRHSAAASSSAALVAGMVTLHPQAGIRPARLSFTTGQGEISEIGEVSDLLLVLDWFNQESHFCRTRERPLISPISLTRTLAVVASARLHMALILVPPLL